MLTDSFSAWHLLALVLSIGTAFIIFYIIKVLVQLKDTLKAVENAIENIEKEFIPIVNNFDNITKKTDSMVEDIQIKSSETMEGISSIKQVSDILKHSILVFLNTISKYLSFLFKDKFKEDTLKEENNIINHLKEKI